MKYLFGSVDEILKRIARAQQVLLLSDYDGTLTPIVERPELARLSPRMRSLLAEASAIPKVTFGVLSGRKITELKKLVKIKDIFYAGNHGFEIEGPGIKFAHPEGMKARKLLSGIFDKLKKGLAAIEGSVVEDKGLTLSAHYRMVPQKDYGKFKKVFDEVTHRYLRARKIKVTRGKKVFEVRPPIDWDKGKAIGLLVKRLSRSVLSRRYCVLYLGDDVTDEDAFLALRPKDIPIRVGKAKASGARYFLNDTREVESFLRLLVKILRPSGSGFNSHSELRRPENSGLRNSRAH